MEGRESNVIAAVATPTAVVTGNPGTACVVFVNHLDAKCNGSPIVVVVSETKASVVTALYDRRYSAASISSKEQLWP